MKVYCVFFVSDVTLNWELFGIYATNGLAEAAISQVDDLDKWEIEAWGLRA